MVLSIVMVHTENFKYVLWCIYFVYCFVLQERRLRAVCQMAHGTDIRIPENSGPITPAAWTLTTMRYSNSNHNT